MKLFLFFAISMKKEWFKLARRRSVYCPKIRWYFSLNLFLMFIVIVIFINRFNKTGKLAKWKFTNYDQINCDKFTKCLDSFTISPVWIRAYTFTYCYPIVTRCCCCVHNKWYTTHYTNTYMNSVWILWLLLLLLWLLFRSISLTHDRVLYCSGDAYMPMHIYIDICFSLAIHTFVFVAAMEWHFLFHSRFKYHKHRHRLRLWYKQHPTNVLSWSTRPISISYESFCSLYTSYRIFSIIFLTPPPSYVFNTQ